MKYVYKGGMFDKTFSTACRVLFHFNKFGVLQASPDGKFVGTIPLVGAEQVTVAKTLTPAENGKTILYGGLTSPALNLPKASSGIMRFTLMVDVLPTSGVGARFIPAAGDSIKGMGIVGTAGQNVGSPVATDAIGDTLEITSDGNKTWFITRKVGTWAAAI